MKNKNTNLKKILKSIETKKPLIHHITNNVTVNDCANITLNWGALPVMAPGKEEADQMVVSSSALVLNIGTPNKNQLEAMIKAGNKANDLGIPVILDPVGVGATEYRTEIAKKLLAELELSLIKGNKGEISILAGESAKVKGVESVGEYKSIKKSADKLAENQDCIVVVSGVQDLISDGVEFFNLNSGNYLMGEVVGTGCMLGSTLGVFMSVAKELELDYLEAAKIAIYCYNFAGEKAALNAETPGAYKIDFMDNIYKMKSDSINEEMEGMI